LAVHVREDLAQFLVTENGLHLSPQHVLACKPQALEFWYVHALLHAALRHPQRRGGRDARRWNIACDIVVNGMIAAENTRLELLRLQPYMFAVDSIRSQKLEHLSVEEIYAVLERDPALCKRCLGKSDSTDVEVQASMDCNKPSNASGTETPNALEALTIPQVDWPKALRMAALIEKSSLKKNNYYGSDPWGLFLDVQQASGSQLPWRQLLWQFLTPSLSDFHEWDRRFVGEEIFLETLQGESLRIAVCVDTSGSIQRAELAVFLAELHGITRCYPHLEMDLWYADTQLHGPYPVASGQERMPVPKGGGGTDFRPFFKHFSLASPTAPAVLVYCTDGYGAFPGVAPDLPVLWVVSRGGLANRKFPFGEVLRLET
jgi:predicted metal-dependent peptidase